MDWQTLTLAVAPALVTASALITQQRFNARAERKRHSVDLHTADRRHKQEVARAAHLDAAIATSDMWRHLQKFVSFTEQHLSPGGPPRPEGRFPMPTDLHDAIGRASERVLLSCSVDSHRAYVELTLSIVSVGRLVDAEDVTREALDDAVRRVHEARKRYVSAARAELGTE